MATYTLFSNPGQANNYQRMVNMLYGWPKRGIKASNHQPNGPDTYSYESHYGWTKDQYDIYISVSTPYSYIHYLVNPDDFLSHGILSNAEINLMKSMNNTNINLSSLDAYTIYDPGPPA